MRKLRKNHSRFENSIEAYLCSCTCNCQNPNRCGPLPGVEFSVGRTHGFNANANASMRSGITM